MFSKKNIKDNKINFLSSNKEIIIISTLSIFVLMIILFLTNEEISIYQKIFKISGYTLITFITTFLYFYLAPKLSTKLFDNKNLTIFKFIIIVFILLILISFSNTIFYSLFLNNNEHNTIFNVFKKHFFSTIIIGTIPSVIIYFYGKNIYLKENVNKLEKRASNINKQLIKIATEVPSTTKKIITLQGEGKNSLEIDINTILYFESIGNYIHIYQENKEEAERIRTTLLNIEKQLQNHKVFVRNHRAFIVNILKIKNIINDQNKLQIELTNGLTLPISRSYKNNFI